ncbi:hypothetical protein CBS101457_005503 [Exobasidium rhododendri]|nr:hypothetical protein CBS101457_005503 [Exobasidium rhododendri]
MPSPSLRTSPSFSSLRQTPKTCADYFGDLAPPPFSLLPLPIAKPEELFAFDSMPSNPYCMTHCFDDLQGSQDSESIRSSHEGSFRSSTSLDILPNIVMQQRPMASSTTSLPSTVSDFSSIRTPSSPSTMNNRYDDAAHLDASLAGLHSKRTQSISSIPFRSDPLAEVYRQGLPRTTQIDTTRPLRNLTLDHWRKKSCEKAGNVPLFIEPERKLNEEQMCKDGAECLSLHAMQTAAWNLMQMHCEPCQVFDTVRTSIDHASYDPSTTTPTKQNETILQRSRLCKAASSSRSYPHLNHVANESLFARLRRRSRRMAPRCDPLRSEVYSTGLVQLPRGGVDELELASRVVGLSWGCSARELWEKDSSHQWWELHRASQLHIVDHKKMQGQMNNVEGNGAEQKLCHRAETTEDDAEVKSVRHPRLQRWSNFYRAYAQGRLDLSETPSIPKGVPDFECCPKATTLCLGRLDAPTPDWEEARARTYHRLELNNLSEETLGIINDLVESYAARLKVEKMTLHCLEENRVLRLSRNGLREEEQSRRQALCAHVLLNRNRGMIIPNVKKDWRFEETREERENKLTYYAGMPILAANGLPVAVISVWDKERSACVDVQLLRNLAREVGHTFECHHRKTWETKVRHMAVSLRSLRDRLDGGQGAPFCCRDSIMPTNSMNAATTSPDFPLSSLFIPNTPLPSGWTTTHNAVDLESLAGLGMLITLEDVERIRLVLDEMARHLQLDSVYLAAVCLPWGTSSEEEVYLLSHHHLPTGARLSYKFHQALFSPCPSNGETSEARKGYLVRHYQGTFNLYNTDAPRHPPLQPLEENGELTSCKAGLTVSIERMGKLGFVVGGLSKKKSRVIGIEDLRYMEAMKPALINIVNQFRHASRSAQSQSIQNPIKSSKITTPPRRQQRPGQENDDDRVHPQGSRSLFGWWNDVDSAPSSSLYSTTLEGEQDRKQVFPVGSLHQAGLTPRPRHNRAKSIKSALIGARKNGEQISDSCFSSDTGLWLVEL